MDILPHKALHSADSRRVGYFGAVGAQLCRACAYNQKGYGHRNGGYNGQSFEKRNPAFCGNCNSDLAERGTVDFERLLKRKADDCFQKLPFRRALPQKIRGYKCISFGGYSQPLHLGY